MPLNALPTAGAEFSAYSELTGLTCRLPGHRREAPLAKVQKSVFWKDWFDQLSSESKSQTKGSQIFNDI